MSSPIDEEINIDNVEDDLRIKIEQAHSLHFSLEEKATHVVDELILGCNLTPKSYNLAIRLHLYIDIKDKEYYVMESLMVIFPIQ